MDILYEVSVGDTIAKVANRFGVRPIDLLLKNQQLYSEKDYIYPGMKLYVPRIQTNLPHQHLFECYAEYGPTDLESDIKYLKKRFQSNISIQKIGKSVMGKPIYAFVVGNGKKEVFYSGGWHANEWMTSKFLMDFLKELLKHAYTDVPFYDYDLNSIFENVKLFIVPMVNPDGIELVHQGIYETHPYFYSVLRTNKGARNFDHWSSNIRGVDLNHQWPAGWEREAKESPQVPWPRHYSGKGPLTEPEARAVHLFTQRHNFAYVLAFHSQGQVIYWGYNNLEPKCSQEMVNRLSLVSSYVPIRTADSDGGFKDWFIQDTGRPGFTIEVGVGTNPLPFSAYSEIWANNSILALEGLLL